MAKRSKPKIKLPKLGTLCYPRSFVPGYPLGLSTDTLCRVVAVTKPDRICVVRDRDSDDGQSWWLYADAVRMMGDA